MVLNFKESNIYYCQQINIIMWECPVCKREFRNKNQQHSCEVSDVEFHFLSKEPVVLETYDVLIRAISKCGSMRINPVKNAIIIQSGTTFLAVKPKNNCLDIEFLLDYRSNYETVDKIIRSSKSRFAHFVRLSKPSDITKKLVSLLKESYLLNIK